MVVREVAGEVERLGLAGRRVLVAVSGGVDSTVLLHALHELSARFDLDLSVGHVNHGLRGAESEGDEVSVRARAADLGLACEVARADPSALRAEGSSRDRLTLQEAARCLRYDALRALAAARAIDHIATAHTADDQAETVLLRLLRGTGPDGLAGIPDRSPDGQIVRPLLRVSRQEVERFARSRGLSWREDSSNERPEYARNRLRHHWLPGLAREFNPQLLRAIADLAEAQRRDREWIESTVEQESQRRFVREGGWLHIDAKDWSSLPPALSRRVARDALRRAGSSRHVTRVHLGRIVAFLADARTGTHIELPGGIRLVRERAGFRLGPLRGDPEGPC